MHYAECGEAGLEKVQPREVFEKLGSRFSPACTPNQRADAVIIAKSLGV